MTAPKGSEAPPTQNTSNDAAASGAGARFLDLLPRILSGMVLAGGAMGLTYWGLKPFAVLVMAVALVLCWEWSRIVRGGGGGSDAVLAVHAVAVGLAVVLGAIHHVGLALVVLLIGTVIVLALRFGERARFSALGVLYAGLPAVALLWLRGSEPYGFAAVMFLFAVVWTTDVGAYAAGRAIGGPKLWPAVSPNKTWAGLIGGVLTGALAGMACGYLLSDAPLAKLLLLGLVLGLVAQGGDLAESALKRHFHVKDSSNLIPGHGGFMDRVDGLVAAAVAAALFAAGIDMMAPSRALLFWS